MRRTQLAAVAALAAALTPAAASADIVIGVSGAMTGPAAGSYAPAIDAMRIYFDRLNASGGIDGTNVRLVIQDDQGEASRGAANVTRLISQEDVVLVVNSSLSSTYAPMIAETSRAGVPLLFAGSVCPQETYPPARPNLFCTTAFAARYDSRAALGFLKERAEGVAVKLGLAAMAIPVSRGEIDFAEELAGEEGITVVAKEVVPPPTPDYTPFATNIREAGADWAYSWAPWVTEVKTLEALRQLGWDGNYITWAHLEAEKELTRLRDEKLFALGANALFLEELPVHGEIREAVEAAGSPYPTDMMAEGWIGAMVIEAALRRAGAEIDGETLIAAMNDLSVDTKGLRGSPITWTAENHFRTHQSYRVYRWTGDGIAVEMDWRTFDVE